MSFKSLMSPLVLSLLLYGILAAVLLLKRVWRSFPIFVAYCVSGLVLNLGLYGVYFSGLRHAFYPFSYWLNEGVGLLLGLAVVYEIFRHLLLPYHSLRRLARQSFQGAVVFLVVLGCVVAYVQPIGQQNQLQIAFVHVEQATRILEVGLLLLLFLFASAFGLHWRQYAFGMALGLGVFAAVELVALTMFAQFGGTASSLIYMCRLISFNVSLLIWISYILAPELAQSADEMPKRAQLEQWNRAVMELIYQ